MTERDVEIVKLLKSGLRPFQIIQRLKCNPALVSRQRRGLKMRPFPPGRLAGGTNKNTVINRVMVLALKAGGATYADIGNLLGVTRQAAAQLIREKLTKDHCEDCGKRNVRLHAHHADYALRIVQTLCTSCHRKRHIGGSKVAPKARLPNKRHPHDL